MTAPLNIDAQYVFSTDSQSLMPFRTANNAVCGAFDGTEECVYSFTGIDSTKALEGIHLRSFKYSPSEGSWEELAETPDTLGKVAAAASTVDGIIYIIGGYHVFDGPPFELSSNKVHRYDPVNEEFLSDGEPIPVAIDDQVQDVWRDSLIYVVTGWSDVDYVPNVQIYDPANDAWQAGTQVPSGVQYESFGASGVIIGDTIYYHGGSIGSGFSATGRLRKGVIDPSNPTQITWSTIGNFTGQKGYRSAPIAVEETAFWIGGSEVTYNYDGIAYIGGAGVPALSRALVYEPGTETLQEFNSGLPEVMDLRGAALMNDGSFYLCGGMEADQTVSNGLWRITIDLPSGLQDELHQREEPTLWPNPIRLSEVLHFRTGLEPDSRLQVIDSSTRLISELQLKTNEYNMSLEELGIVAPGLYVIRSKHGGRPFKLVVH